jgi:hypothetical protein
LTATNWKTALLSFFSFSPHRNIRMSQDLKVKLPDHRAGLPGKVISFYIVPLDPAHKAGLAGHVPVKSYTAWRRNV